MFALSSKPGPVWATLIAAHDDEPAVRVLFAPVSPKALRHARRAVSSILRAAGGRVTDDVTDDAGDAFTAALIRHGIREWEGIVDEDGTPIAPTPDREIYGEDGELLRAEPGTITAFLAEPRLVEAADREYVLPWTRADAEKNGSAPSRSGTSAGATQAPATADSAATPGETGVVEAKTRAPRRAPTKSTSRKRTKAKLSGS